MRQFKTNIFVKLFFSVWLFSSCNDKPAAVSEKSATDTTQVATDKEISPMPDYDQAMDSYVSGGKFVKKLGDTLGIKMYEFTIKPGENFALHSHPDHTAYVLQGGKVALYIKAVGRQDTLDFPTGTALINGPVSDSGKNIGKTIMKMVVTDIYRPRRK
jgi:quercetin dioxygenase-like cupin family protein